MDKEPNAIGCISFFATITIMILLGMIGVAIISNNILQKKSSESMGFHIDCINRVKKIKAFKDEILFVEVAGMFNEKPSDEVAATIMKLNLEIEKLR